VLALTPLASKLLAGWAAELKFCYDVYDPGLVLDFEHGNRLDTDKNYINKGTWAFTHIIWGLFELLGSQLALLSVTSPREIVLFV
jgi:hypothetical protein